MKIRWRLRMAAANVRCGPAPSCGGCSPRKRAGDVGGVGVGAVDQGPSQVKLTTLIALCTALECTPNDLFEVDTTPVAERPAPAARSRQSAARATGGARHRRSDGRRLHRLRPAGAAARARVLPTVLLARQAPRRAAAVPGLRRAGTAARVFQRPALLALRAPRTPTHRANAAPMPALRRTAPSRRAWPVRALPAERSIDRRRLAARCR